ncbi:MAG: bifunctional glutamate N-acetyltransferase/amino-acid acetyltransferase ArgJ [Lachnospiraceae bacterium]|nr:bifunctional glutamate N-acetyltransferase/amino-acid acetyltransferase ArgJ [Lachnospiraceae bacterium]
MRVIDGGITAPQGFKATGKHIGIKKIKKDLALLSSDVAADAAGVYTTSLVKAAPILWNKNLTDSGKKIKGLVCISGNANACTGNKGIRDNETMAETFAKCIGAKKDEILTAATGIIGLDMPMDTIINGINDTYKNLSNKREEAKNAAAGIITTDTFIKEMAVQLNIGGKAVKIGAMCKGSGMIHPNMATVLSFITTDLNILPKLLHKALLYSVKETYNMISVDGATSTNDMCLIMANGLAGNEKITEEDEFYEDFKKALYFINEKFAKDIVHDGEGAGKFIEVNVNGAKSDHDARLLAKSIVTNNLVKTAMYGEDANWGRVVAAMGGSGGYFDPSKVDISFESEKGKVLLMKQGEPVHFDENEAADVLSERDIMVQISLEDGIYTAKSWGCDLGHEYVRINGEYRSRT